MFAIREKYSRAVASALPGIRRCFRADAHLVLPSRTVQIALASVRECFPICVIVPAGPHVDIPCTAGTIELSLTVALGALSSAVGRIAFPADENHRCWRSVIHRLNPH